MGAQGDGDGFFGGERQRFVHRIRVERLTPAEDGGERLDGSANDVILWLLRRERASCRLCVEAQPEGARILRPEPLTQRARPDASGGAVFRHFFEQIVVRVEEEAEPWREFIDMQPAFDTRLDVCQPIGEGERQFLGGSCARFTDVIAADRDRIPLWHMAGGELDRIDDQTHRWFGREDILVLGDVFLQNIP